MLVTEHLKKVPLFSHLTEKELELLLLKARLKEIPKGSTVHDPEEVCKHITLVIQGTLHASNYSLSGQEQIVCSFSAGSIFGFPVVFGDLTYPEHIIAESNCHLLYISRDTLLDLFSNKSFLLAFLEKLSKKIKSFSSLVEILSFTSVRERVCKYLLKLAKDQNTHTIKLISNKTRMAKELGTNRVVVSRIFKTLEEENIINRINDQQITIIDLEQLEYFD